MTDNRRMTRLQTPCFDDLPETLAGAARRDWEIYLDNGGCPELPARIAASLPRVWAASPFTARQCARRPALLQELLDSGELEGDGEPPALGARLEALLAEAADDAAAMAALRRLRQREMVRIAWRDIAGWANLERTVADLSALADAALECSLAWLTEQLAPNLGRPAGGQSLVVIAMGKLGAQELNFSSDIDLIFCFAESGETSGGRRSLSHEEYFTRLAQGLTRLLQEVTADGFVFRVDARLRPFGDSGPLVMSFSAMEGYYEAHARDWERYAMIKARICAGDKAAGERLMGDLRPFVYRRYLDFGAFEALREMKELINTEVSRKGLEDNVKLGRGGIREVEFIGQVFQLIRGGREPGLRSRRILEVLDYLGRHDYLPTRAAEELAQAYRFLRQVEHRLQQIDDRQTQALPAGEEDRARVALGMGFDSWEALRSALDGHRGRVARHFAALLNPEQDAEPEPEEDVLTRIWKARLEPKQAVTALGEAGFADGPAVLEALDKLRQSHAVRHMSRHGRPRLDRFIPQLLAEVGRGGGGAETLGRLLALTETIAQRSVYLSLLVEHPVALEQLVRLCAASPWIAAHIRRQPLVLDELLDPRSLYAPPGRAALDATLQQALAAHPEDLEQQMEALRQFKHAQVLRVAAADIGGRLPLAEVSNHLSAIAESILEAALALAWSHLSARHGEPRCMDGGQQRRAGFAIIAYGKLGGLELGYGSDLDLVFLHDSRGDGQATDGPQPLDNNVFFTRLAQRVIHLLTTYTPSGRAYEVDTRLRPSGQSGLLVSGLDTFADYQAHQAWTWEHQALVRARPVAGDGETSRSFAEIRRRTLTRPRDPATLARDIVDMRERMRRELCTKNEAVFDLKQGLGGITDIEFMVQYAVLRWAPEHPELLDVTDNLRQLDALASLGLLAPETCTRLREVYFAYRAEVHRRALQELPAHVDCGEFGDHRAAITALWARFVEDSQQGEQSNDDG